MMPRGGTTLTTISTAVAGAKARTLWDGADAVSPLLESSKPTVVTLTVLAVTSLRGNAARETSGVQDRW